MATLQKLDILSIGRLKTTEVEIDGDMIIISEIGAADNMRLFSNPDYQDAEGKIPMAIFKPALLVRCIVDDDGKRIFTDEDTESISRMPPKLFERLCAAAMKINGLSFEAESTEIKNYGPSPGDSSFSD